MIWLLGFDSFLLFLLSLLVLRNNGLLLELIRLSNEIQAPPPERVPSAEDLLMERLSKTISKSYSSRN